MRIHNTQEKSTRGTLLKLMLESVTEGFGQGALPMGNLVGHYQDGIYVMGQTVATDAGNDLLLTCPRHSAFS